MIRHDGAQKAASALPFFIQHGGTEPKLLSGPQPISFVFAIGNSSQIVQNIVHRDYWRRNHRLAYRRALGHLRIKRIVAEHNGIFEFRWFWYSTKATKSSSRIS